MIIRLIPFCFFFLFGIFFSFSQEKQISIPKYVDTSYLNKNQDTLVLNYIDSLFTQIKFGKVDNNFLSDEKFELTKNLLNEFSYYESTKDSTSLKIKDKQLLNIFPISDSEYNLEIGYLKIGKSGLPILYYILNLIAKVNADKVEFKSPIDYLTRQWKRTQVGNITYIHQNEIDTTVAKNFDLNNKIIAEKFNLKPEKFDFYICENYQKCMTLLGRNYSVYENGKYRDGFGVVDNTIFSVMGNEDFSHDIFHYYSSQLHERMDRNWVAEEGLAYLWGNAYYTDGNGHMINFDMLVNNLIKYINKNPNVSVFDLFINDRKIYNDLAPEISVRSVISGILAKCVYEKKGMKAINQLIASGRNSRTDGFLNTINTLVGINKENFDTEVKKLLVLNK